MADGKPRDKRLDNLVTDKETQRRRALLSVETRRVSIEGVTPTGGFNKQTSLSIRETLRRRLAANPKDVDEIVEAIIGCAKAGSFLHLKMLVEMHDGAIVGEPMGKTDLEAIANPEVLLQMIAASVNARRAEVDGVEDSPSTTPAS